MGMLLHSPHEVRDEQDYHEAFVPGPGVNPLILPICFQENRLESSVVPRGGIEPPTLRFSVACSTN
jgi:hypothetical protein